MTILEKTTEEKCVWKKVAEHDKEKREKGESYFTFDFSNLCHNCDGKDKSCKYYYVVRKKSS